MMLAETAQSDAAINSSWRVVMHVVTAASNMQTGKTHKS